MQLRHPLLNLASRCPSQTLQPFYLAHQSWHFCFLQQQREAFGDPTNLPNENYNQEEILFS